MATVIQRNLTGGELSPSLHYRVGLAKYKSGAALIKNWYVTRHGGLVNRPGTKFIGAISPLVGNSARLVPFIFSDEDASLLEFGNFYMRVIKDGAYLTEDPIDISNIDISGPIPVINLASNHNFPTGVVVSSPVSFVLEGLTGKWAVLNGRILTENTRESVSSLTFYGTDAERIDFFQSTEFTANFTASGATLKQIYQIETPFPTFRAVEFSYVQSLNVLTIAHKSDKPYDFLRNGGDDRNWTFEDALIEPSDQGTNAAITTITGGVADANLAPNISRYVVTYQNIESGEESLPSPEVQVPNSGLHPKPSSPMTVNNNLSSFNFTGRRGVLNYYKSNGYGQPFGFIGSKFDSSSFVDIGVEPDYTINPPEVSNFFVDELTKQIDNFPGVVSIVQQRKFFGNFSQDAEAFAASRVGLYTDFSIHRPLQDDDAIFSKLSGLKYNEVRHIVEVRVPILFTATGEWILEGNPLTPTDIRPSQHSYNGCSKTIRPVIIGETVLYVQARETIIRDLGFDFNVDGYSGNDLTLFANHLFDDFTITSMDYQQIPDSILWVTRSDGVLLSLTYIKEQQIFAWCQHDLGGGKASQVVVVPEGNEDAVYVVVEREVNDKTLNYVERLESRSIKDKGRDNRFMDSYLTYDGNATVLDDGSMPDGQMILQGGTNWTYDEDLNLTNNRNQFNANDIGNEIHLYYTEMDDNGCKKDRVLRCRITAYTDADNVTVRVNRTVPEALRNEGVVTWGKAVDEISGLWHLEGETLAIVGDGQVVGSPNNRDYAEYTVSNGAITLDKPYVKIAAGLPYLCDFESLAVDSESAESIADKRTLINSVGLAVQETRGLWVGRKEPECGDPLDGLEEIKPRECEMYDETTRLRSEVIDVNIESNWEQEGKVFVRQVDPVPATILAILPNGLYPFKGG